MKKLLLIGAGHAHVEVLRQFSLQPAANAAITMVNPHSRMTYGGMLPGLVAGHYAAEQCQIDLAPLARKSGIELLADRVVGLDAEGRVATTASGGQLEFDFASIDIGVTPFAPDVPGLRRFALLAKPVEVFLEGWERVRELAREGGLSRLTVVGGGPTAVELMLAMQHRLRCEMPKSAFGDFGFSIVTEGPRLLHELPEQSGLAVEALCVARGISLLRGATVKLVERDCLQLSNGAQLASDITVWACGARPARWLAAAGLACDMGGFMQTDASLRSPSHKRIYGAGDCSLSEQQPRSHIGICGLPQGPALAANLRQALASQPSLPWAPPQDQRVMLSLGARQALGMRGAALLKTPYWLNWRWKDWTDRRWIGRFRV